jgi:two-component system, chemotaxis family, protein-glutamate methylesterase/glutaminase
MAKGAIISSVDYVVAIGGSAGSLEVVMDILPYCNPAFNIAIVVVLHRKPTYESQLVAILADKTRMPVKEVEEKELLQPGVFVVPADYHLLIEPDSSFTLDDSEKVNYSRPVIGVLLSGANADGVAGLAAIKRNGGLCIVQNPASAEIDYMPQQAINSGVVDIILNGTDIGPLLRDKLFGGR